MTWCFQVTRAFGARAIPKYAELLAMEDLPDEDRCRALQDLRELLSSPNSKYTAVTKELMFTCADLTQSISAEVRTDAALVVASLVLFETVRSFLHQTSCSKIYSITKTSISMPTGRTE